MSLFTLLADEAPAEQGFFVKIWNSLVNWFLAERGWMHIVIAVAVILVGLIVLKIVLSVSRKLVNKTKLKGIAGDFILTILKVVLVFIYLIIVLRILGIDTTSFVALLTVGTLAISLALQSIIANFASGMILVSNHPFEEGDYVEVSGISGTVV